MLNLFELTNIYQNTNMTFFTQKLHIIRQVQCTENDP
jgi:hypothetical protein